MYRYENNISIMLPRIINFDIKGIDVELFSPTLDYMPYLKKYAEDHITRNPNGSLNPRYPGLPSIDPINNIILDANILSPGMIQMIATHLINNKKIEILRKELMDQYEEKYIEECLMYLCATKLLVMIFPEKSVVNNKVYKIVIASRCLVDPNIKNSKSTDQKGQINQYKLLSGEVVEGSIDSENYLLLLESYNNKPTIQSTKGWKYFCVDLYKNIDNVIISNDEYYVTPMMYEKITHTKI